MYVKTSRVYFCPITWKGEDGNHGLRNLYNLFFTLLSFYNQPRSQDEKTEEQRKIRRRAAELNFSRIYEIEARINDGNYVQPEELKVWKSVNYDIYREVLRARLRAFHSCVIGKEYPDELQDRQSSMIQIYSYITLHHEELKKWQGYQNIVDILQKMGITLS